MINIALDIPPAQFIWIALVLGLIFGSFYNVCIHRYITEESIVRPPSRCPKCGHLLSWWENIPLISFLFLRGRCRHCRVRISLRYPLVEALSALWALGLALQYGPSLAFLVYMVVGGILIVAGLIDLELYILPDVLVLPGTLIAILGASFVLDVGLQDSLLGAGIGAGFFYLVRLLYKILRGVEGLGLGDVKLMLLLGGLLGWQALPVVVVVGAGLGVLAGIAYMGRNSENKLQTMVPFGPFLALAGMLYVLFGEWFRVWWLG